MNNEHPQQNAGKYESELNDCRLILQKLVRLGIIMQIVNQKDLKEQCDKAQGIIRCIFQKLEELQ